MNEPKSGGREATRDICEESMVVRFGPFDLDVPSLTI
jgi:hypothetical protein